MAANTDPIYSRVGDIQWPATYMTAANTTADLTSGTIYTLFQSDDTEGGWLDRLVLKSTPAGNTTQTVLRIWLNNGSTTGTAANNVLLQEVDLAAVTADADNARLIYTIHLRLALPPGYDVYGTLGTASANGWACTAIGGKY